MYFIFMSKKFFKCIYIVQEIADREGNFTIDGTEIQYKTVWISTKRNLVIELSRNNHLFISTVAGAH